MIRSFDNVTYSLPTIGATCQKIVAKDCSSEKMFLVLASNTDNDQLPVALTAYISNKWKVEFVPSGDKITVKLNGKEVPITEATPYIQKKTILGKEIELFAIEFNGAYYTLNSQAVGFVARTDGVGYTVAVDHYYHGKLCGLCGGLNCESAHAFRGANGCVYSNSDDFAYSYVVPSATCPRPTFNECVPRPNDL